MSATKSVSDAVDDKQHTKDLKAQNSALKGEVDELKLKICRYKRTSDSNVEKLGHATRELYLSNTKIKELEKKVSELTKALTDMTLQRDNYMKIANKTFPAKSNRVLDDMTGFMSGVEITKQPTKNIDGDFM